MPTTLPRVRSAAAIALFALALLAAGCGNDDEEGGNQEAGAPEASQKQQPPAREGGCRRVEAPAPRPDGGESRPKGRLAAGTTYEVEMQTSCGAFTIRLDQKTAPTTAASFAELVRREFFDGTVFHRIIPGFVIQGGDPTASGMGGPGYSTRDIPPSNTRYTPGVVAMAKTGPEPPGTAGSQFYVVTGPQAQQLPPEYAVLGKVVEGLDVTKRVGALGDAAGTPLQSVVIEKATLSES